MSNNKYFPISTFELKLIKESEYRPDIPKKYFSENGVEYINLAEPSELMMLSGEPEKEPKVIKDFLFHLFNNNYDYMMYFINWIAYGYVLARKTIVAVGLFGLEGTGKGILQLIMEALYGQSNCSQLNDASFKSNYNIAKEIEHKRFINIDELSRKVSEKNEGLFKTMIDNISIVLGRKIKLHAQCLFTTNFSSSFFLSNNARRYTILETGQTLESTRFLGFGSYEVFIEEIYRELPDFSKYLKSLEIDYKLANTALETPEKELIMSFSRNNIIDFHDAIVNLKSNFFAKLEYKHSATYLDINYNCEFKKRFNKADLTKAFYFLYGIKISTIDLMKQLRTINKDGIFDLKNTQYHGHSNNIHYIYPKGKS